MMLKKDFSKSLSMYFSNSFRKVGRMFEKKYELHEFLRYKEFLKMIHKCIFFELENTACFRATKMMLQTERGACLMNVERLLSLEFFHINYVIAKLIISVVMISWNFAMFKYVVYK